MADQTEIAFRRSAERLIPDGARVLVAVSGGSDSVALLHLLVRRASSRRQPLLVAHLDHGLRRGSATDRRFVERLARSLDVPVVSAKTAVDEERRHGESIAEAARRVRRRFLVDAARANGCACIAVGHTLDDQAETVLMRLLRGAGPAALTGMSERGPGPFVRPLLAIERRSLRAFLERRGLAWREDPSNRDERFDRNRLRRRIMPSLETWANPRVSQALVRAADRFREDASCLDAIAARRFRSWQAGVEDDVVSLPASRLAAAPPAIAGRVARLALRAVGVPEKRVSQRIVDALVGLASASRRRSIDLPGHVRARRRGDRIDLLREPRS